MKKISNFILIMGWIIIMLSCSNQKAKPPKAKVIPHADTTLSDVRTDDYFWLRQKDNPEVIDYLEQENKYTASMTAHTVKFQDKLYNEMVARIKETDESVPYQMGEYFYYSRTEEGKQYEVWCRKKGSLEAAEEILLDENKLAENQSYFEVGVFEVSPNQKLLAYSVDTLGSESYTIYIRDLSTGQDLADQIPGTYYSVSWANDNKTIFYNILDEATRPYKIYKHRLGTEPKDDQMIYHEQDEKFFLQTARSKSGKYLFLEIGSQITSEIRFIEADQPDSPFKVIVPRENGVEYYVSHHNKSFYIQTNENALDFKLIKTPVNRLAKKYWSEVIPARENVTLIRVEMFKNFMVVSERKDGLEQLRIRRFGSDVYKTISFDESVYTVYPFDNFDFNLDVLRFNYASPKTPKTVYDYNMISGERQQMKQEEVLGGFKSDDYEVDRIFVEAADGVKIPVSLLFKKGLKKDGNNPLYLYGYGSYGNNTKPRFSSRRFSLIDRGFVLAIAHIRGSSTMGRKWYEDGKLLNKKNTFTDFIACAEYLIAEEYTNPQKLVAVGGSAGGLLMGAVVNMRPDLFKAVVAHVPFVDVINTMLDASIPLTVIEYEEWGNPNLEKYYHYMKSYSPYDHVQAKDYPNMLITAGLNDPRVQYWEPAKWTAKLRALKTDNNLLLLKTNMGAGHGGASGRYDYLKEIAFEYAFILDMLGMQK